MHARLVAPATALAALAALVALVITGAASGASDGAPRPASPPRPAAPPVRPVVDTYWGRQVTDDYRYMEALDADTVAWMKAHGAYTRSVLDSIPERAALAARIATLTGSIAFTRNYARHGGRTFYEERAPRADDYDLVVRDSAGKRRLVDLVALRRANGGRPYAINFSLAAPDGSKVAAGISEGGSEAASVYVYDAATGRRLAGPLDRADPGFLAWSSDSRRLYVTRLKQLAPGDADIEKYRDTAVVSWDLRSEPRAILGSRAGRGPAFLPDETPTISVPPGTTTAIATSLNGVQNEVALWTAPASRVDEPGVRWTPLVSRDDEVTAATVAGDAIYLLSHRDAPTFQVLAVRAGQPLRSARVVVAATDGRVLDSIHAASDALYVRARRGVYSTLLRVAHGASTVEEIPLPLQGVIEAVYADARTPGIAVQLESFVVPPTGFAYEPARKAFVDLGLTPKSGYDSSRYEILDLDARSADGVQVPNTLIRAKNAQGPRIVVIQAYGAYGYSQLAEFSLRAVSFLEAGGTYASCHVRGGGELGEAWRLAGKDAHKPNSWRDLIACAEDLIARGYTTRDKLFVFSGSAGGITIGRAMTERPELFAGVLALVPGANTLRQEFQPNGPLNVPEFGSLATEQGFANLYEMDTLQHIRRGVQYPAVLITTGLNDPRVAPWEPAKFAAALQASGSTRPVLLRVDVQAGHGVGSTKAQDDALYADLWAFVFWRAGLAGWAPRTD